MRAGRLVPLWLLAVCPGVAAQHPVQSVIGTVRQAGLRGLPLPGAEVLIATRQTTTDTLGKFRIDSLPPGQYPVTVRHIGFGPIHSRIAVLASEPTEVEFYMVPAPVRLPAIVVEGRRTGIYGVVGDTAFRATPGAKVEVLGNRGGEALTDSLGRFSFPDAGGGTFMVRVTKPGFAERRITVDLENGKGRELTVLLAPWSGRGASRADDWAMDGLRRRLVFELQRSRMTGTDLERFGSMPLCDLPRVRAELKGGTVTTVILNGITRFPEMSLCAWRVDDIELIEFGGEIRSEQLPGRALLGPSRRPGTGARMGSIYVILWERW